MRPPRPRFGRRRIRQVVISAALLWACSEAGPVEPLGPSEPVRLVTPHSLAHQEEPSLVAMATGRLVAAWKEMASPASVGMLGYGWSDDGGATWTTGLLPGAPGGAGQSDPWLAVDGAGSMRAAMIGESPTTPSQE